jgi:sortase A
MGRRARAKFRFVAVGLLTCIALFLSVLSILRKVPILPPESTELAVLTVPPASSASTTLSASAEEPNTGLPVRLVIPRLKLNAPIVYVGVTAQGAMDVPENVDNAGWYKYGAHPGDIGSAVIAGHLNGAHGEPGVFMDLGSLRVGDSFTVFNDVGENTTFLISKIKLYNQNEQPDVVFHSTSGTHVNLITCTGSWNRNQKRYSKRLVVFGDAVPVTSELQY